MHDVSRSVRRSSLIALVAIATAHTATAEPVATINGADIDSTVFNAYLESRTQKALADVTAEERDVLLRELSDIYLLSTTPRAKELQETDEVKVNLELQFRGFIAQAVATDFFASNEATEDEIFEEYSNVIGGDLGNQFKARHILVETQSKAVELIEALQGGADFATLAQENSTGPTGPNGGDLGWFAPNAMVAPFSEAVQALEDGQFSQEPVQTQFGWHVILREDSRPNEPPTLDSIRDAVKQQVEARKFQAFLEGLREEQASE
ncbi:MAG: peptidylprolyl isomerase [Pseudomonadota bacterium]